MNRQPGSRTMPFREDPRQCQQALHDAAQAVLHDHEVIRVGAPELFELALEGACRHPDVRRKLVANGLGRTEQVPHGVGQSAGAVLVDHESEQFAARRGEPVAGTLPDEARVGRADPGQRGQQHLEAFSTCRVGAALEIVAPVLGHPYQAGNRLGPLGIAAHPEQVLGGPGRH